MKNLRVYGKAPYSVAVIHGGPGAPGSIAPVASELSKDIGVLEPLQAEAAGGGLVETSAAELPVATLHRSVVHDIVASVG